MSRDEFIKKNNELYRQLEELRAEYIKSNSIYPVGTKLKAIGRNGSVQYGFVKGYELNAFDIVVPILACIKKDGTPHPRNTLNIWYDSTYEVCND